jgi:hypothetical protein
MTDKPGDSGDEGCFVIVGVVALAGGSGLLWGPGVGWFVLGATCLMIVLINLAIRIWNARRRDRQ